MNTTEPQNNQNVCSFCNWTNTGLLNVGEPNGKAIWICHGCTKRAVDNLAAANERAERAEHLTEQAQGHAINLVAQRDQLRADKEKAEKACAEMRVAIASLIPFASAYRSHPLRNLEDLLDKSLTQADNALSSTCGTNYVSKDELKPTIKVLEQVGKGFGTATPTGYEIAKEIERLQTLTR